MGDEESYEKIKQLFGHTTTQQELDSLQLTQRKLKVQKKKERLRANEAAKALREAHKLPPLDHMFEKNHEVKFKQFKLNALACHITGGSSGSISKNSVELSPITPSMRVPSMSLPYQFYEPKKVYYDDDDFATSFFKSTVTMDQLRAKIDRSTLNIPSKPKQRLSFVEALEKF